MSPVSRRHLGLTALMAATLLVALLPATALAADPIALDDELGAVEDAGSQSLAVLGNDSDPDNDALTITETTTPDHGTATPDGAVVAYTPDPNYTGVDTFDYTISDGNTTATATVTVTVSSVNDAPSGAEGTVVTLEDTAYAFATGDFGFSDPNDSPPNVFQSVKITTLPGAGLLTDNGFAVSASDRILATDIGAGDLVFTPSADANGTGYASFTFQVQDDGGNRRRGDRP